MQRIAIVQQAPEFLDKSAGIERAVSFVEDAVKNGAKLVVFPEAFIPGYPAWIWRLRPGGDFKLNEEIHARLVSNAVDLGGDDLSPLCAAAAAHEVTIVCGLQERDASFSRATLYNTVVTIGANGKVLNRHRKLMPTNPERMVWGLGDASGLKTVDTPVGKLGALICWENYMPLSRFALYAQGVELYLTPTYDSGAAWLGTLQHIAREGRCWVVNSGLAIRASDLPDDLPGKRNLYPDPDEWVNPGDSAVVAPGGEIVAGPLRNEQGTLYAEVEPEKAVAAKRTLDVAGHYGRPDVFQLNVNTLPNPPITFEGSKD